MSCPPALGSVVAYPNDPAEGAEGGGSGGVAARPRSRLARFYFNYCFTVTEFLTKVKQLEFPAGH